MIKNIGLPYLGSKRRLAPELMEFMVKENPDAKYFIDVFGGGGAMSFMAVQYPQFKEVLYNELNTSIVNLLQHVLKYGITDDMYKWVDRKTFNEMRYGTDWYSGFVKSIFSFGNDQRSYLYGKQIEFQKQMLHEIVIDKDQLSLNLLNRILGVTLIMPTDNTLDKRRLNIGKQIRELLKSRSGELNHLERVNRLEALERITQLKKIDKLQHLQGINQLTKIKPADKLKLVNMDYTDLFKSIKDLYNPKDVILYLDPPYRNTKKYEKGIDHDELYQVIRECRYRVYLSEYDSPFTMVHSKSHQVNVCATQTTKVEEKLFMYN